MGLFVCGVSHHQCPIEIREKIYLSSEEILTVYRSFEHDRSEEIVIVSTCNRSEFYGIFLELEQAKNFFERTVQSFRGCSKQEIEPYLYHHSGEAAVQHLYRVASGLDSMVVGENEILGQLRESFRMASDAGVAHSVLFRLFEKALKIGKDVRTKTKINEGAVSIPSVALDLAQKIFNLSGEKVMVLGTGEMSLQICQGLKRAGAEIAYAAGRDLEKTRRFAMDFGAQPVLLGEWREKLYETDILIASTSSPEPIVFRDEIQRQMEARKRRPLFIIDIALPRNVEPEVHALEDVYLYNVDDLKQVAAENVKMRRNEIQAAEELIDEAVISFKSWTTQVEARPTIELLEGHIGTILDEELSKVEANLSEEQKQQLKNKIQARILSAPLEKIKDASRQGITQRYLHALRSLFRLDEKSENAHSQKKS